MPSRSRRRPPWGALLVLGVALPLSQQQATPVPGERIAAFRYRCGPLVSGAHCAGDRTAGEPTDCAAASDATSCAECCEARGAPGCCEWSEGTLTATITLPSLTDTVTVTLPSGTTTVTLPTSTQTATTTLPSVSLTETFTLPTATTTVTLPTGTLTLTQTETLTLPTVSLSETVTQSATMTLITVSRSETFTLPTVTISLPSITQSRSTTISLPSETQTMTLPTQTGSSTVTLPSTSATYTLPSVSPTARVNESVALVYTGQCHFFAMGTAAGGGGSRALTCLAATATETPSITHSTTHSTTPQVADVSCSGAVIHPTQAAVGFNFTLTVFCRRGVAGEQLFFTQTPGYCDEGDAVLLGPAGDTVFAALQYRDQHQHPIAVVPPIFEPAEYQVCLLTVRGFREALGARLTVVPPRPKDFVWLQHSAGADAAFTLTVDGMGLNGLQFAVATDPKCKYRVRETARVGTFIDEVEADGPIRVGPGTEPGGRWTGWTSPTNPREIFEDTAGRTTLLRRSDGMLVFAEDYAGGYDVSEDGTLAVTTLTLSEGTYWHCYRRFDDEDWAPHARFLVRRKQLTRVATTPRHTAAGQPFILTLFGPGTTNVSSSDCRIALIGDSCTASTYVADSVDIVDDTTICRFLSGAPTAGWYHACIGDYNSTYDPRITSFERGDYDGTPGGATFLVWTPPWPLAEVSPQEPTTKEWFTVVLTGGDFPSGSFVKLVDHQDCNIANMTEEQAEVEVHDWSGPMVILEDDTDPCTSNMGWAGHLNRGFDLMPEVGGIPGGKNTYFHLCPAGQVTTGKPLLICDFGSSSLVRTGSIFTDDDATCRRIGGRWHFPGGTEHTSGDGRNLCDIALCAATRGPLCPGPGCGVSGGLAVQGYGHCLEHRMVSAAFRATAEACSSYQGRWGDGNCWLEICGAADLPSNWHPQSYPTWTPTRYYVPRRVSAPLMLRRPAYPVHVCGKRKQGDAGGWQWLGAFGIADSCRVARAKACRRIACGSGALALAPAQPGDGAGEYNPGPCAVLGAEGADEEARGIGPAKGLESDADWGSWQRIGARARRLGRPVEPSALLGPVTWNKRLQGPSEAMQRVCAAMACADEPGGHRVGRVGDPAPARFGGPWPAVRYRWWVPSPDGLQVRLLLPPHKPVPDAGTELHVATRRPIDIDPYGETPIGFTFTGIDPSILRMGLLANSSLYLGDTAGRFYNDSATPLRWEVPFYSADGPCSLTADTKYRAVFRLRPFAEMAIWLDNQGGLACHMRHPTAIDEFDDQGWRLAFVLTWPAAANYTPSQFGSARITLHP
eukprot:TRINITY_DN25686_c0_g2_i1.p1 TRINITY_DN25686_c0_g2~~TRINITY_DN25686_c0_g2_i1.p1  ORF type:complete len:1325 (+),score=284.20 TRINITY_DN25686_c0_g2_i1:81-3977(+)